MEYLNYIFFILYSFINIFIKVETMCERVQEHCYMLVLCKGLRGQGQAGPQLPREWPPGSGPGQAPSAKGRASGVRARLGRGPICQGESREGPPESGPGWAEARAAKGNPGLLSRCQEPNALSHHVLPPGCMSSGLESVAAGGN